MRNFLCIGIFPTSIHSFAFIPLLNCLTRSIRISMPFAFFKTTNGIAPPKTAADLRRNLNFVQCSQEHRDNSTGSPAPNGIEIVIAASDGHRVDAQNNKSLQKLAKKRHIEMVEDDELPVKLAHRKHEDQVFAKIDELQKLLLASNEAHQTTVTRIIEHHFSQLEAKMDHKIDALQNTIVALDARQKELEKTVKQYHGGNYAQYTNPYGNCWDSSACHNELSIADSEPAPGGSAKKNDYKYIKPARKSVVVKHNGISSGICSVLAKQSMPVYKYGSFYYEVKIVNKHFDIGMFIGLATKQMPLHNCVGHYKGTYAYEDNGTFLGHTIGDELKNCGNSETKPTFDAGDIVGCGLNLATRQIAYTLNGKRLDTDELFVVVSADQLLFPCVSLFWPGDKIEANFGPIFKYARSFAL